MGASNDKDNADMKKLEELLHRKDVERNKIQLTDLNEYRSLFLNPKDTDELDFDRINSLSDKFSKQFNLYRPIEVFDGTQLLFKIPQLFVPIGEISSDYRHFVDKFRKNVSSDIPKYQSEGIKYLLAALYKSQDERAQSEGFESFRHYVSSVRKEFGSDIRKFQDLKENGIEIEDVIIEEDMDDAQPNNQKPKRGVEDLGLDWE